MQLSTLQDGAVFGRAPQLPRSDKCGCRGSLPSPAAAQDETGKGGMGVSTRTSCDKQEAEAPDLPEMLRRPSHLALGGSKAPHSSLAHTKGPRGAQTLRQPWFSCFGTPFSPATL